MHQYDNTHPSARRTSTRTGVVREGGKTPYGYLFVDELDTDEVRALSPRALRVLLILWGMSRKGTDLAWPSQIKLGLTAGLSRESVSRAVHELESAGLIERIHGPGRGLKYRCLRPPSLRENAAKTLALAAK